MRRLYAQRRELRSGLEGDSEVVEGRGEENERRSGGFSRDSERPPATQRGLVQIRRAGTAAAVIGVPETSSRLNGPTRKIGRLQRLFHSRSDCYTTSGSSGCEADDVDALSIVGTVRVCHISNHPVAMSFASHCKQVFIRNNS